MDIVFGCEMWGVRVENIIVAIIIIIIIITTLVIPPEKILRLLA